MNTPRPCDTCRHLYYNAMYKDDPSYMAECRITGNIMAKDGKCEHYSEDEEIKKTCLNCANYLDHGCLINRMEELEDDYTNDYCGNWCKERIFYVNAYEVTRNYGGPEEGGWWYNLHVPVASIPVVASSKSDEKIKLVEESLRKLFKDISFGDIYSMKGGQELLVCVEDKFAEIDPKERPHYE